VEIHVREHGGMRTLVLRATIVGTSLFAALGAAEVIVRAFMPQDLGLLAPWHESHPIYRFRHYPNMDAQRSWGTPYRLRTNSHGIRADHEEPYDSPGERRVVVHGDSLTFGVGVENDDTFVQRTQRRLRQTSDNVDVLNLGVSGQGPDQEYLLFLEEGRRYSPRICVIAVCLGNDLDEVAWSRAAFRLDGDRLVFIPYEPPLSKRLAETGAYRWLVSRAHLLVLTRVNLVDFPIQAREFDAQARRDLPLPLALAIYRDFVAAVKQEGAIPVMLLLPTKQQIAQRRRLPTEDPIVSSVVLRDALLQFCAANAVTCVDTMDAFARPDVPFDSLFIPGDDHFSAAGHQVITDVLLDPLARMLVSSTPEHP
jgi:GDSL-like Lipase/Acylhydrolase family